MRYSLFNPQAEQAVASTSLHPIRWLSYNVLLILFSLFIFSLSAKAEFAFSPTNLVIEADDGQGQGAIILTNPSDKAIRLQISFNEWDVTENNEVDILASSNLVQYLKASPTQLTIAPKHSQKITINVALPKEQPNKEYKFLTNILEINDERSLLRGDNSELDFKMNCMISSALYVLKGKKESFQANFALQDSLLKKKDEKFKYELFYENSGNQHIREIIKIKIYNLDNEPVAERYLGSFIAFPTKKDKSLRVGGEFAVPRADEISVIEFILSDVDNKKTISKIFDL